MRCRSLIGCLALLISLASVAQNKVDAHGNPIPLDPAQDPHYSLLFENEATRVFSVELQPHQETAVVVHPADRVVVPLSNVEASDVLNRVSGGIADFQRGHAMFYYRNIPFQLRSRESVVTLRAIVAEVKQPSNQPYNCTAYDANCIGDYTTVPLPVEQDKTYAQSLDRDTVRVTDVQIRPGETWKSHLGKFPYLIVPVSDLELIETSMTDDAREYKKSAGDADWAPHIFSGGTMKNSGDKPARFVAIEFK